MMLSWILWSCCYSFTPFLLLYSHLMVPCHPQQSYFRFWGFCVLSPSFYSCILTMRKLRFSEAVEVNQDHTSNWQRSENSKLASQLKSANLVNDICVFVSIQILNMTIQRACAECELHVNIIFIITLSLLMHFICRKKYVFPIYRWNKNQHENSILLMGTGWDVQNLDESCWQIIR